MHELSDKQKITLLANPNVQTITKSFVIFKVNFKIKAAKLYLEGVSSDKIFKDTGIPIEYFKTDFCRNCIKRWAKKLKSEGEDSLKHETRGNKTGRPPKENFNELSYEELIALVQIQKEVIEEIKKQKALMKKR